MLPPTTSFHEKYPHVTRVKPIVIIPSRLPLSTVLPSADRDTNTPDQSPAASPSMSSCPCPRAVSSSSWNQHFDRPSHDPNYLHSHCYTRRQPLSSCHLGEGNRNPKDSLPIVSPMMVLWLWPICFQLQVPRLSLLSREKTLTYILGDNPPNSPESQW